jgi:hypothetical protein
LERARQRSARLNRRRLPPSDRRRSAIAEQLGAVAVNEHQFAVVGAPAGDTCEGSEVRALHFVGRRGARHLGRCDRPDRERVALERVAGGKAVAPGRPGDGAVRERRARSHGLPTGDVEAARDDPRDSHDEHGHDYPTARFDRDGSGSHIVNPWLMP